MTFRQVSTSAVLAVSILIAPLAAGAQERNRVSFASGASSAALSGTITGHDYLDFVLGAAEGQTMAVSLDSPAYFNILPPGSDDVAIYIGSMEGRQAEISLPESGDYVVRLYLMGNNKDAGKTVPYELNVAID